METAKLKIHLFRVEPMDGTDPLVDLLKHIQLDPIEKRVRQCGGTNYRLEDIAPPKKGSTVWALNFVRMRDAHGPGKVSKNKKLTGFDLQANEYFGEDTAVLYDQSTRYAIVQYNHWGVRPNGLEQYLSSYKQDATNIYDLKVKLDLDSERKFQSQNVKRRIQIGIDLTKMQSSDLKARRSLTQMAEIGKDVGADRIYLTLSIGSRDRKNSLKESATKLLNAIRNKIEPEAITQLVSYGSSSPEEPFETVDLLEEKIYKIENVDVGTDRRITLENRIKALSRAMSAWSKLMKD